MDYEIECPKHSGVFDYRTGQPLTPPACKGLNTYQAKIENGDVMLALPA